MADRNAGWQMSHVSRRDGDWRACGTSVVNAESRGSSLDERGSSFSRAPRPPTAGVGSASVCDTQAALLSRAGDETVRCSLCLC